jgi:hypothetical protein
LGFFSNHVGVVHLDAGVVLGHTLGDLQEHAFGGAHDVGLVDGGDLGIVEFFGVFEGGADDPLAALAGVDLAGNGVVVGVVLGEVGEGLGMGLQDLGHLGGHGAEFNACIEALGVLPEHHQVDAFLEVEGVAGVGLAGTQAGVEVEHLAHAHDGAAVDEALALESGVQFGLGVPHRLGGDGAEHGGVGSLEEVDGALGEGLPLLAPEFPADVAVGVGGIELQGIQAEPGRLHDLDPHAIPGQPRDLVAHVCASWSSIPIRWNDATKTGN